MKRIDSSKHKSKKKTQSSKSPLLSIGFISFLPDEIIHIILNLIADDMDGWSLLSFLTTCHKLLRYSFYVAIPFTMKLKNMFKTVYNYKSISSYIKEVDLKKTIEETMNNKINFIITHRPYNIGNFDEDKSKNIQIEGSRFAKIQDYYYDIYFTQFLSHTLWFIKIINFKMKIEPSLLLYNNSYGNNDDIILNNMYYCEDPHNKYISIYSYKSDFGNKSFDFCKLINHPRFHCYVGIDELKQDNEALKKSIINYMKTHLSSLDSEVAHEICKNDKKLYHSTDFLIGIMGNNFINQKAIKAIDGNIRNELIIKDTLKDDYYYYYSQSDIIKEFRKNIIIIPDDIIDKKSYAKMIFHLRNNLSLDLYKIRSYYESYIQCSK